MPVTEVMDISNYGMTYQKMRIDAATLNIANANVIQPGDGTGFKPLSVSIKQAFDLSMLNENAFEMTPINVADKKVFQPNHPSADSSGFVRYANVDLAEQMITITQATRAYEANIKSFNAQMSMTTKALEIGK